MTDTPKPRHRITIELNVNNMNDLSDKLTHILQTLCLEEDNRLDQNGLLVIGGGFSISNSFNPNMTKEKYDIELMEWFKNKKNEAKNEQDN